MFPFQDFYGILWYSLVYFGIVWYTLVYGKSLKKLWNMPKYTKVCHETPPDDTKEDQAGERKLDKLDKLDKYTSLQNRNRCQSFQHPPFARTSKTQSMIELLFRV